MWRDQVRLAVRRKDLGRQEERGGKYRIPKKRVEDQAIEEVLIPVLRASSRATPNCSRDVACLAGGPGPSRYQTSIAKFY